MKKKILIICKAFYPEISPRSFRATELAKEFARQGHEVTVMHHCNNYDYKEFLKDNNIRLLSYGPVITRKINIPLFKKLSHKANRLLYFLIHFPDIQIMWHLRNKLKKMGGYDLIISIAAPHPVHWGVAWARSLCNPISKVWIADCGDPFMGNKLESFRFPFYFKYMEKWAFRKADFITVPVENAINGYYKEFHQKIKIIPQGFNFDNIRFKQLANRNLKPTFAYAGGIAVAGVRSPVKLIKYLLSLPIDFEFHIYSKSDKEFLMPMVKESSGRIILHDVVSRDQLLPELAKMDFLVNLDNGTNMQVPSKLIDYAITGRPVLNINPENPQGNLVNEFLNGNYEQALKIEEIDRFRIENVCKSFLELLNEKEG